MQVRQAALPQKIAAARRPLFPRTSSSTWLGSTPPTLHDATMNPASASTPSCSDPAGKTPILLLKTRSVPNDGYAERFSSEQGDGGVVSFEPTFVPVLEHQFLDTGLDVVRRLLKGEAFGAGEGKEYGGMIFTSQRAVEAFAALVEEGKGTSLPVFFWFTSESNLGADHI
jgi:hypothetical protein